MRALWFGGGFLAGAVVASSVAVAVIQRVQSEPPPRVTWAMSKPWVRCDVWVRPDGNGGMLYADLSVDSDPATPGPCVNLLQSIFVKAGAAH